MGIVMDEHEVRIFQRIKDGDKQAMADYLQLRRSDLLVVILSKMSPRLRSRLEAEDIFQEVSAGAVQNMDRIEFSDQGPFGWLCEIAVRRIIDADRRFSAQKRNAHKEVGIHGLGPGELSQAGLVNLLVASITSPSHAFSRQQREFKLLAALDKLPAEQNRVLKLRYAKGKSNQQIAEEIGKSDGATRVMITRALKKLKSVIEELES